MRDKERNGVFFCICFAGILTDNIRRVIPSSIVVPMSSIRPRSIILIYNAIITYSGREIHIEVIVVILASIATESKRKGIYSATVRNESHLARGTCFGSACNLLVAVIFLLECMRTFQIFAIIAIDDEPRFAGEVHFYLLLQRHFDIFAKWNQEFS